nr:MAG TPA: hypothetical protein [Caudoviricetes sp.]
MLYNDTGLVIKPFSFRFDELRQALTNLVNTKTSKYASEAKEILNNITSDLNKLHKHSNVELENNYKTSLVPMLENVYNKLRYF